jgi:hypothetical protein
VHDPFGRGVRLPGDFSRDGRVRLLGEAAQNLLAGQMPEPAALMFLAGGLMAWLENGGDLLGQHWRVKAPAGSHRTPAQLWASSRGATEAAEDGIVRETFTEPLE